MTNFIHLKVHTEYSLVDSIISINNLMAATKSQGMMAVALTDDNNLFATIKFYQQARQHGIKPIIGADLGLLNPHKPQEPYRFTCLCQNLPGYHNLLKLVSRSFMEGQEHGIPVIKPEWLSELNHGLIILSGAEDGNIGQTLLTANHTLLTQTYNFWQQHFPERFYLEVRKIGHPNEALYLAKILDFASTYGLPLVATNEVRFLKADDFEAHEARVCIHNGQLLADPRRKKNYTNQQYLRSPAEMTQLFADLPDALANTVEIAKRCTLAIPVGQYFYQIIPCLKRATPKKFLLKPPPLDCSIACKLITFVHQKYPHIINA